MYNFTMDPALIAKEVFYKATRSGGPGGQHVNKVSTAAILYWDFLNSNALDEEKKQILKEKISSYINKQNLIYIRSDEYRDLERNKEQCLIKLTELIKKALHKPKKRKKTKPSKSSQRKRVDQKVKHGTNKKLRRKPDF